MSDFEKGRGEVEEALRKEVQRLEKDNEQLKAAIRWVRDELGVSSNDSLWNILQHSLKESVKLYNEAHPDEQ